MGSRDIYRKGTVEHMRQAAAQRTVKHVQEDLNGWDCEGNNVSSGLCSSNVVAYVESLGKKVLVDGANVSIVDPDPN